MKFTTWYAVYYIMKKGLKTGTITQWEKTGEIPNECIESPDVNPRGGYMPLGLTGYICPLMAKEGEKALIYDNTGKYYFVDALTERLLAFYCYVHIDIAKVKKLFQWKSIPVKNEKTLRQIVHNFKKTHERIEKKLSKKDIPIYAHANTNLRIGRFVGLVRDYSTPRGMKKKYYTEEIDMKTEIKIIKAMANSNFLLRDMCDKFLFSDLTAEIFLHSHGIDSRVKRLFPRPIWKKALIALLGVFLLLFSILSISIAIGGISRIRFSDFIFGICLLGMGLYFIGIYIEYFEILGYERRKIYKQQIFKCENVG